MTEVQSVYKTIVVMGNVLHEEEMEEEEEVSFEGAMDSDTSSDDEIWGRPISGSVCNMTSSGTILDRNSSSLWLPFREATEGLQEHSNW